MADITLKLGRAITAQLPNALEHEWLLTNGIGGFAAGTVADINTRRYAVADALVEKRILMRLGKNSTYVQLKILRSSAPLHLKLRPFCTYRDYHSQGHGSWVWRFLRMVFL